MWKRGKRWDGSWFEDGQETRRFQRQLEDEELERQKRAEEEEKERQYFAEGSQEWRTVLNKLHKPVVSDPDPDHWSAYNDWIIYKVWLEGHSALKLCRFCKRSMFKVLASSQAQDEYYGDSENKKYFFDVCTHCE